jgi:hypothetical protein
MSGATLVPWLVEGLTALGLLHERETQKMTWQHIASVLKTLETEIAALRKQAESFVPEDVPDGRGQAAKKQTRYTYTDGPMFYLGQQIVRAMQDGGYPAKIVECFRSWERQQLVFDRGNSKARPGESPHQYFEAVDIVHETRGWDVGEDFWNALASAVKLVETKFHVDLTHGHTWKFRDSAHVELTDWRDFAFQCGHQKPDSERLERRFRDVLPGVLD